MPGVAPPLTFADAEAAMTFGTGTSTNPYLPQIANPKLLDPQNNRIWSTNGQPVLSNNQLVDGTENLEPVNGIEVHVPSLFSIQEMKVDTSNYEAENGRATGAVLTNVSRTGQNAVHADIFEFNSNRYFRARDYFDPIGLPQSNYNLNQFGGTGTEPFMKNHLFVTLSAQGSYLADQNPTFATTPSVAMAGGTSADFQPDPSSIPGQAFRSQGI